MLDLASFIEASRESVLAEFEKRAALVAPSPKTRTELRDHLPEFLAYVATEVRGGTSGSAGASIEHGYQRLRLGYDVDAVVREYRILTDCVFDHIVAADLQPSVARSRSSSSRTPRTTSSSGIATSSTSPCASRFRRSKGRASSSFSTP